MSKVIARPLLALAALALSACAAEAPVAEAPPPGATRGQLVRYVFDFPDHSEVRHALRLASGTEREVRFARDPELASGTLVDLWGSDDGDSIRVSRLAAAPAPATPSAVMKPTKRWAFVLVETSGPGPLSPDEARMKLFSDRPDSIRTYYREVSYGLQDLDGDVYGPFAFDTSLTPGGLCSGFGAVGPAMKPMLTGHYDQYLFYFESVIKSCDWSGVALLGMAARPALDSYYNASDDCVVLVQEPGHNFGMVHSSAIRCTRGGVPVSMIDPMDPGSSCTHDEYGNPFDPMGGGPPIPGAHPTICFHMNGVQKAYEEWLDGCNIVKATKSGLYTIYPLELPTREMQVLQVPLPTSRGILFPPGSRLKGGTITAYYLEMRAPVGLDAALKVPRLFVVAAGNLREARARGNPNWLVDATPETPTAYDADLPVGKSIEDPAPGGPKFTLVAIDNSRAVVKVELDGVPAAEEPGLGTCLDDTPYTPGKVRIPDAGPDAYESPEPDRLPPKPQRVNVQGCAYGGSASASLWLLLAIAAGVGRCRRRRASPPR